MLSRKWPRVRLLCMSDKRVQFDFSIAFTNGGGLQGQGFRLDIDGDDISDEALASYIIQDLRLLMVGEVVILNKTIIEEPHKRQSGTTDMELTEGVLDLRKVSQKVEDLLQLANGRTLRVVSKAGESYVIRRAAD